ncbi:protein-export chaperone SecB [Alterinioella nitratireducens]|uniref:protein-export chaperone SecB n=1 Tax=Alterinioella nitratireducens TaxID=2735915 RepID=UPI0015572B6F|nr:protein-export chaperone SecB [Alterinioella nitratireducens]NPD18629.1 protein-export chaperone SecB [Alterinioella nitratireducens]
MAEENGAESPETTAGQDAPVMPKMQILGQFVRDLSFENIAAQKGVQGNTQPEVQMQIGVEGRKRQTENQYDVVIKLKIDSKTKEDNQQIFLIEMEYAGIFQIENIKQQQLHPFLHIECPRMLFPYVRRIVSDVTRDGGFPALNLDNVDFIQVYRNDLARRAQAKPHADA